MTNSEDRRPKRKRRTTLMNKFGLNLDQYNFLLERQNHQCSICKKSISEEGRNLAVDHCHSTLKVRGLLCSNCNQGLGRFKDNVEYLKNAIEYLTTPSLLPEIEDSIGHISHDNRQRWRVVVETPDGKFPSYQHASDFYKVHSTTIASWCNGPAKKDGFISKKMFVSLNEVE